MTMYDVEALRQEEFPSAAEIIYFNNASVSLLATSVQEGVKEAAEKLGENAWAYFDQFLGEELIEIQRDIARLIGAGHEDEIVPIVTTSLGINSVAQALPWAEGDNICLCSIEFPANKYPWWNLERYGVEIRFVEPVDGGLTVEALAAHVDEKTRLVTVSGVQFFGGHRTDVAALGAFCKSRGILLVVDTIQSIGHVPIHVEEMGVDILVTGGQKSLLAPPGIGFMYVREEVCERMVPLYTGANGTVEFKNWLKHDRRPLPGAARFMMGTPNVTGLKGLEASVKLIQRLGVENIDQHTRDLSDLARRGLMTLGYSVMTSATSYSGILTFASRLDAAGTDDLVERAAEEKLIMVKQLDAVGQAYIRWSFGCYNVMDDVERALTVMEKLQ